MNIDTSSVSIEMIVIVVALVVSVVLSLEKLINAIKSIKKSVVDDPKSKVVEEAKGTAIELHEDVIAIINDSKKEHDDFREFFDNDKKAINSLRREIDAIAKKLDEAISTLEDHDVRITARESGEKITLLSIKALINERLNVGGQTDLIDAASRIDNFLIEDRK